jgi:hypothetical protein
MCIINSLKKTLYPKFIKRKTRGFSFSGSSLLHPPRGSAPRTPAGVPPDPLNKNYPIYMLKTNYLTLIR